jgi:hypothetical protein
MAYPESEAGAVSVRYTRDLLLEAGSGSLLLDIIKLTGVYRR